MCGRFAQAQTREEYLAYLADEAERDIAYDPEPIGRYNVAPGTKVLLLSERDEKLHLDPVLWGYAPGWWDKATLINARVETAPSSRMFKPLWQHGRAIVFADGWFEWKKEGDKKQPYFIHRKDGKPIFMAAIGSTPFERGDDAEGFLIVTSAADKGLVDIHDRRPLVLSPGTARKWMRQGISGKEVEEIITDGAVPTDKFTWHAVKRSVGNVKNQGEELIKPVT
ncbi:SOS response-associated peptidase [Salmonella enterica subsp. enterica serovar Pomona]|uniref:Abasic site processing protein n=2 Tax=Salmonella enterica TaxID=28901 RepID=A0A763M9C7_SALER|nr:SOS response-associated peptidase [Salmonella enterica]EBG8085430.1 SOS response-associated peptidase [Salmonella enterica subsp. enterica serovar Montevideo]EBS5526485.1 SOS response-associated peptidase [Salmonella enterica subsp. enterica serovar Telelkebir]ECU9484883.1 SOS response-associated peptidase [Salmonella enterica subsp. enterica serovar Pomona]EAW2798539.1 SOS response-associated peptidase [Salmonella enterica]